MNDEAGITELDLLITGMEPALEPGRWVFVSLPGGQYGDGREWEPLASVREREGLTLVLEHAKAQRAGLSWDGVYRVLLLQVHSSLQAVGLTAAVSGILARHGIAANVIAGAFHDHVLVPEARADEALALLQDLARSGSSR